jgi:uncharacterized membrane protein YeaQ/YmgE (transglycosylase-associated protein family)
MSVTSHSIIVWIIIGAIAGGIASTIWNGHPYRLFKDIPLGILGAVLASGAVHASHLTVGNSIFLDIVISTAGALIGLVIIRLFRSN